MGFTVWDLTAGSFGEAVVKVYTRDILTGLAYLHQHRIMHRDIKVRAAAGQRRGGVKQAGDLT